MNNLLSLQKNCATKWKRTKTNQTRSCRKCSIRPWSDLYFQKLLKKLVFPTLECHIGRIVLFYFSIFLFSPPFVGLTNKFGVYKYIVAVKTVCKGFCEFKHVFHFQYFSEMILPCYFLCAAIWYSLDLVTSLVEVTGSIDWLAKFTLFHPTIVLQMTFERR